MYKRYKLGVCFIVTLLLCACSGKTIPPIQVTADFLDAFHAQAEIGINQTSLWKDFQISSLALQQDDYVEGIEPSLQVQLHTMMLDFQHKELKEQITGDQAVVTVELTRYAFDDVKAAALQEAAQKAETLSDDSQMSESQKQMDVIRVMYETLVKATYGEPMIIDVNLIKANGKWFVSDNNERLQTLLLENLQILQS